MIDAPDEAPGHSPTENLLLTLKEKPRCPFHHVKGAHIVTKWSNRKRFMLRMERPLRHLLTPSHVIMSPLAIRAQGLTDNLMAAGSIYTVVQKSVRYPSISARGEE
jgi:hypothetical protein